ncbi:hypothetical protein FDZ58_04605 [Ehrlichia ruminantium]|nr:hypothetical protein FDZ68_04600 [Ehrlichia ruminantium]QLK51828.1 hypothetical protein FDZ66_04600 [Ehrlichia ruminantium]QLK53668.1 hypothetical protein FDZ64_04600 [Ehrlichia ruminantium]QLK59162.1 hypothetical protein FDZ58_04605 [Ehrlichia ruminantium]
MLVVFCMLLSKDKNKKKKDLNNQENDKRNQTGESGVKPEVPNQQSIQDTSQGVVEGATAASDIGGVGGYAPSVSVEIESSSSEPQPSSSLENIYMRQGAKPKTRTKSKVAQQSTGKSQSIRSKSGVPPRFVKRITDVSLEKAGGDTYICGTERRSDQSATQSQSTRSKGNLPPRLVKRMTDVSLDKAEGDTYICGTERRSDQSTTQSQSTRSRGDLPSRFTKYASDILLTKPQNDDLDIHDTEEELIRSFEELDIAPLTEVEDDQNVFSDVIYKKYLSLQQKYGDINKHSSNSCLARLRGMHIGHLNFLMKRLFMAQGNTLVMREEHWQMLSSITQHYKEAVVIAKLNFMSQYLLAFGAYKVSRLMISQRLSNPDFYAIDNLLLELTLVSYRERVNLYCVQRDVLRIYAMIDYNSGYNPSCSNINFCRVVVQLFRDLLFARQSVALDVLDLQLVNFLIINVSIQIDIMTRYVYNYFNDHGYSTGCCRSEVLNLCNRVCKGFSYMYNATPNAISRICNMPLPKVLLHMCSSKFCDDELSRLIQGDQLQFHHLLSGIVENISAAVRNEGLGNVERILGICEEIIRTHDVCDDQQEDHSQLDEEELCYDFNYYYGYGYGYGR